tara:strand:- start:909 stop:1157 length:249 start_codon:yes stop_codon:yes gene_type:complete
MITVKGKQYPDFNFENFENLYAKYIMNFPKEDDPMDYLQFEGARGLYLILLEAEGRIIKFNGKYKRDEDDLIYVLNVKFVDN